MAGMNPSDCPEWFEDVPKELASVFTQNLFSCFEDVSNCAKHEISNDESFKRWHRILFQRLVPRDYYAGNFRQEHPSQFCLGIDVNVGGVDGASYREVVFKSRQLAEHAAQEIKVLELNWATLQEKERAIRLAVIAANSIGTFIKIHPFINGNGRVSRVYWRWWLLRFGVPMQVSISPRPPLPYGNIMARCMRGDHGPLAKYILKHLAANSRAINIEI